jgi:anti-sigma factor RsiW
MTPCPTSNELSAYHDGQLPADRRDAIASHLAACSSCTLELSRLVALSQLFAQTVRPHLSQIARYRLHAAADAAMERGLIRIGWSLSGIAASVLIVGSAWLMQAGSLQQQSIPQQTAETAPPWVGVARTSDAETVIQDARTPAAAIYLADASADSQSGSSAAELP